MVLFFGFVSLFVSFRSENPFPSTHWAYKNFFTFHSSLSCNEVSLFAANHLHFIQIAFHKWIQHEKLQQKSLLCKSLPLLYTTINSNHCNCVCIYVCVVFYVSEFSFFSAFGYWFWQRLTRLCGYSICIDAAFCFSLNVTHCCFQISFVCQSAQFCLQNQIHEINCT